jgi:nicotinamidase-related amidase
VADPTTAPIRGGGPSSRRPRLLGPDTVLLLIDVQQGFDEPCWGRRNNPEADTNIATLHAAFGEAGWPIVYVQHDAVDPGSPLHPSQPGNRLKTYLDAEPALLVRKQVNSAWHGTPDLHSWLQGRGATDLVIAGITTNHCCETTARIAGNLGYSVWFALDATYTFDRVGPLGYRATAAQLSAATAVNLHKEFARVVNTEHVLAAMGVEQRTGDFPGASNELGARG